MNKYILLFTTVCTLTIQTAFSQNESLSRLWAEIEKNNLTLAALRQESEAVKMEARIGLTPENPEVEFAYLWGNSAAGANRLDFSVTQSFDFPSAYAYRNKIAKLQNQQADNYYRQQRQNILIEAGNIYYNIVYQNIRINDMRKCLHLLNEISQAYKEKLDAGLITIFELNKVKLTELNLKQNYQHAIATRDQQLTVLKQLNGGNDFIVQDSVFQTFSLKTDFDSWLSSAEKTDPTLTLFATEMEISQQQLKLEKSLWAPQFSVGYMREQVFANETFQGIKAGVSLPLWHNAHTLKQTQLKKSALQMKIADEKSQLYYRLQAQYNTITRLLAQIDEYEKLLKEINSYELLQIALQKGEISLTDYLMEYSVYHDSHEQLFELYRDLYQQYVDLQIHIY
ncbi:MAG: TolC family protein [Bacteroidales bacterium]|nr:TolC family protein [Bacteroidales bacterium]